MIKPRPGALFRVFTSMALQGFGGVLPVAQRMLVDRHGWLSTEEFIELLALSQVLPGPNVVNLALIYGHRCGGWRSALAAASGLLLLPLLLVLLLAMAAGQARPDGLVAGALKGMGVAAAGLVAGTALRMRQALMRSPMGPTSAVVLAGAALLGVGLLRWPLMGVLAGLGSASVALAWWRLRR